MSTARRRARGVDYEQVSSDYLEHRQLRRGAAGWVLLAGLGVAYVISGDFAGWNFGLAEGGWGGLFIATVLMATMYTCMVFGLAELASALPVAGAGYGFARRALGPLGGFATGMAILIEYAIAPAAISVFIGGYIEALGLFGLTSGWPIYLACYAVFVGIHLYGVGEAMRLMFAITAVALVALVVFVIAMAPKFEFANLFDIEPTGAAGANSFIPFGYAGVLGGLVYGIWFFLAVEGVPLAAEEANDPERDMPRGIITAMTILLVTGCTDAVHCARRCRVLGDCGLGQPSSGGHPIRLWRGHLGSRLRQLRGLSGPSRQLFLDRVRGALLINIAVFGATVSYVLMMVSHIVLRIREPELERPYRTPGGVVTTAVALTLALTAVIATFFVDEKAAGITALIFVVALAYFWFYSRHRLVASAPEEEFAAIQQAESELS